MSLLWCSLLPCEGVDNSLIGDISWKELYSFNVGHNCRHIFIFPHNLWLCCEHVCIREWTGAVFISGKAGFEGSFVPECDMKRTEMSSEDVVDLVLPNFFSPKCETKSAMVSLGSSIDSTLLFMVSYTRCCMSQGWRGLGTRLVSDYNTQLSIMGEPE